MSTKSQKSFTYVVAIIEEKWYNIFEIKKMEVRYMDEIKDILVNMQGSMINMQESIIELTKGQARLEQGQVEMRQDIKALQEGQVEMRQDIKVLQEEQAEMKHDIKTIIQVQDRIAYEVEYIENNVGLKSNSYSQIFSKINSKKSEKMA